MLHKARRESLESKLQGKSREPETKAPGLIFSPFTSIKTPNEHLFSLKRRKNTRNTCTIQKIFVTLQPQTRKGDLFAFKRQHCLP